ncbi:glycosyltransferase family 39 protein [Dysgonomonas sp. 25]|uniref:glycosyltransferase family 39 protein n=1 Tax=Dysgonomonas sp. 25 TaxID=2302933 RepID=UPI0013D8523E|nr:glycosyltransferase family 39 protein [Dysgonomonas sp. 25]NDV69120.1 hypothetical protein [Dysgonomonas sp. 25]
MNKRITVSILKYGLILICLLLFVAIGGLLIVGYDTFFGSLINKIALPESKHVDLKLLLSPERKLAVWGILIASFAASAIALYFRDKLSDFLIRFGRDVKQAFRHIFSDVCTAKGLAIMLISFSLSVYLGLTVPVSYDEAYTYLTFVNKPFYYSATFYPSPNNHVLYSLLANATEMLPFLSELFCLRLPAILLSLLSWIVIYSFIKRDFAESLSVLATGIVSVLFMSVYYSFMARGYSCVVLLFVVCFWASYNIINKGSRTKDWMFFMISSILGVYTVPSFVYPLISLNALILICNYRNIRQQIAYNLVAVASVGMLYAPIILLQKQGLAAITNNRFVAPIDRFEVIERLPSFIANTIFEIFGIPSLIIGGVVIVAFVMTCIRKNKQLILTWIVFLASPVLLLILHSVIPFPRTFIYYGFVLVFLICLSFRPYIEKLKTTYLLIAVIIIQVAAAINFTNKIDAYEGYNTAAKQVNEYVLKGEGKKYYLANSLCNIHFEYEYSIRGYDSANVKYDSYTVINADTISGYDYVIIDKGNDATMHKTPLYENAYQVVYSGEVAVTETVR